jgi:hypothetical protein
MAMGGSAVLLDRALKASLMGTAFTLPSKIFLAILEVEPHHALTGTEFESGNYELNYTGYKRIEIPLEEWNHTSATSSAAAKYTNKAAVKLEKASALGTRHTCKFFAICDAVTAGNQFYTAKLAEEQVLTTATVAEFPIGTLEITGE